MAGWLELGNFQGPFEYKRFCDSSWEDLALAQPPKPSPVNALALELQKGSRPLLWRDPALRPGSQ